MGAPWLAAMVDMICRCAISWETPRWASNVKRTIAKLLGRHRSIDQTQQIKHNVNFLRCGALLLHDSTMSASNFSNIVKSTNFRIAEETTTGCFSACVDQLVIFQSHRTFVRLYQGTPANMLKQDARLASVRDPMMERTESDNTVMYEWKSVSVFSSSGSNEQIDSTSPPFPLRSTTSDKTTGSRFNFTISRKHSDGCDPLNIFAHSIPNRSRLTFDERFPSNSVSTQS